MTCIICKIDLKKAIFIKVLDKAKGDENEESIPGHQPWASSAWRLRTPEEEGDGSQAGLQDKEDVAIVFLTQGWWEEDGM